VKKWLLIVCSLVLLLSFAGTGTAAVRSDCDVIEQAGELQFCALSAVYEKDALVLQGLFINTGDAAAGAVDRLKLTVTGAEDALLAEGEWVNDPVLMELKLQPGQTELVELPMVGTVRNGDLSQLNTQYEIGFSMLGPKAVPPGINMYVNQKKLQPEVPAFLKDGSTLVPLRTIFEALGATVAWDGATQTVTARKGSDVLVLRIGEKQLTLNGQPIEFSVPAQITDGSTFVPLRAVSEALNTAVFYGKFGDAAQIVIVDKQQ
jgi:hypothetical protein